MPWAKNFTIGNLGPDADKAHLKTLFSVFGIVRKAYIVTDQQTGESKGFGFVVMADDDQAQAAIAALDGKMCGEFTFRVSEAKE